MGKYKIKIYSTAKLDLKDIVSYLNTLSPHVAIKYYDLIVEKIGCLVEMPERCSYVRDVVLKAKGYPTFIGLYIPMVRFRLRIELKKHCLIHYFTFHYG